ncbi:hypothetical protein NP493_941g01000 [Ridgeia piscesae]|uniref:Uncharacterized protein n=1 Tax=Ridgeia piscesae TaxID=27915 RepID=A0AAD9KJQ4_RIDPI|nr:hypothetical protein NP493_941g01000 [Ridgeia piscesae]
MKKLQGIQLYCCELRDEGLAAVVNALVRGCPDITYFWCYDDSRELQLTYKSSATVTRLLETRPGVTIALVPHPGSHPSWMVTLKDKFGDRVR